jgi:hypothetical protein
MPADTELETWRRQWQADEVIPADLRRRVDRETRNLRLGRYAEIAVTVVIGGGAAGWAVLSQRPIALALVIGVWFFIAVAWATSIALRRDILKPSAATTSAFLNLSIRRCRRRLVALGAQGVLYVLLLAFDLVWIYHYQTETRPIPVWAFLTSGQMLVVWVVTAVLAAAAVLYRRRLYEELQGLLNLRRELGDSDA